VSISVSIRFGVRASAVAARRSAGASRVPSAKQRACERHAICDGLIAPVRPGSAHFLAVPSSHEITLSPSHLQAGLLKQAQLDAEAQSRTGRMSGADAPVGPPFS
jgi:hypothetical protein